MRARHRQTPDRRRRRLTVGILAAVLAVVASGLVFVGSASAATYNFVINSAAWTGNDTSAGDGVCKTSSNTCTLLAAIQEANALNKPAGDVSVTVSSSIAVGTAMTGSATVQDTLTLVDGYSDYGYFFKITAPVSIDLAHRLVLNGNQASVSAAFFFDGPDITLKNANNVLSGGASFVFGPNAKRVTVDGGNATIQNAANTLSHRFAVFREGASNITVANYQLPGPGYYDSGSSGYADGGLFAFNNYSASTARANIVIDNVDVLYPDNTTTSCPGSSCRSRILTFNPATSANVTNGLTFTNMDVKNLASTQTAFNFTDGSPSYAGSDSASISNLTFTNNTFTGNIGSGTGVGNAFLTLPYGGKLTGTTTISGNKFSRGSSGQTVAIAYAKGTSSNDTSTSNSTTASNVYIQDNWFNGYGSGAQSIWTYQTGLVTVRRNTFGTSSASQAVTGNEETSDTGVLYNTQHSATTYSSNQSIRTWHPTGTAALLTGANPAGSLQASNPFGSTPACPFKVDVVQGAATSSTKVAGSPVTLDLYWTTSQFAELYLGSVSGVTGTSATVVASLPASAYTLADGSSTATPVSAAGGSSGTIRVQTQVEGLAQPESSQYSATVAITGSCKPALTLNQASTQSDPTMVRDLHFTLASSVALNTASLTASDFGLTASATSSTIDSTKINARILSITASSDARTFDVVVRVDDSAAVSMTLGASTVTSTGGFANPSAAVVTDGSVTFTNPLTVTPAKFALVTGAAGKAYTLGLASGAPVPTSALTFAATISQPAGTPALSLSTSSPSIAAGGTTAGAVTVSAASGSVVGDTDTVIAHTVSSSDTNYNGLVVPSVHPHLFATDPTIRITKQAYVDVADSSTPAQIMATGTEKPTDSFVPAGTPICFVYTVTNISSGLWATTLTGSKVTDTDTRLGAGGIVGIIPTLAQGAATRLSACTTVIDSDTSVTP